MHLKELVLKNLSFLPLLQPEGWYDVRDVFRFYIQSPFCHPIGSFAGNQLMGVGCVILLENTAWLAHIIVGQKFRKQGIGLSITNYLKEYVINQGIPSCCLLATKMGAPVYRKAGFQAIGEYTFLKREQMSTDFPISSKSLKCNERMQEEILALDFKVCGENRSLILRPYLSNAIVVAENDHIKGYYIPGLEEGPVIATHPGAGIELLKYKHSSPDNNIAVLPAENTTGIEFLKQHGFDNVDRYGTRMHYGYPLEWQPVNIYSRISGNFG